MSEKKLGKYSRTFHILVGVQAIPLVGEDVKRTGFLVCTQSSGTCYVLSAQTMGVADGIPVTSGAPYYNETSTAAFWIIASAASQDVRVEVDGD